jgi:predicted molibdopterin-dependent oxidoreductase YjgC
MAPTSGGTLVVDQRGIEFKAGDTIAGCLLRAGILGLRRSRSGELRGLYCGIGICNECLVEVDAVPNVRACVTHAVDGMSVQTGLLPP